AGNEAMDEPVQFNLGGMKDFSLGIIEKNELHAAIERRASPEVPVRTAGKLKCFRQVVLHFVTFAPCPASGAHKWFAVPKARRIIVRQAAQKPIWVPPEPINELLLVTECAVVGIVAVQKCDSNNIFGNFFNRIEVTKIKLPPPLWLFRITCTSLVANSF